MPDTQPLHSLLRLDPDRQLVVKNPDELNLGNTAISHAFQACGRSFQDCGLYPQAIASYGMAIEFDDVDERVAEAKRDVHRAVNLFFDPGLAEQHPWPGDEFARRLAEKMAVCDGYHVVGGGNVLASYPPSEQGLLAAIANADLVAKDRRLQSDLFRKWLTDDSKFGPVVYHCEGRVVTKVHQTSAPAGSAA